MLWITEIWATISKMKIQGFGIFLLTQPFYIFLPSINKIFQVQLMILPELWLTFCCHQQKNIKNESFNNILVTITLEENMINR